MVNCGFEGLQGDPEISFSFSTSALCSDLRTLENHFHLSIRLYLKKISATYISNPIIAGIRIDFPDSPALYMLQIIFPVYIRTTTSSPIHKLLFQKANPNAINDTGTVKTRKFLL